MELVAGQGAESSESPALAEDYAIIDGVRLVRPYHFDFVCGMKQRWVGQSIVDIFSRVGPAVISFWGGLAAVPAGGRGCC